MFTTPYAWSESNCKAVPGEAYLSRLASLPFFRIAARTFWTERANLAKPVILEPSHWRPDPDSLIHKSNLVLEGAFFSLEIRIAQAVSAYVSF